MSLSLWNEPFLDPMSEMRRMQRDMDSLFGAIQSKDKDSFFSWKPVMDIKETDKDIVIHAELPGVKKEDMHLELKDGILTLSGERKQEQKQEKDKYHRIERSYGKFSRSMSVPKELKEDQIKASFDNGVLEVSFPKPPPQETKKIAIK